MYNNNNDEKERERGDIVQSNQDIILWMNLGTTQSRAKVRRAGWILSLIIEGGGELGIAVAHYTSYHVLVSPFRRIFSLYCYRFCLFLLFFTF